MLSSKEIVCPNNLLDLAHKKKGVKVAVVNAGKLYAKKICRCNLATSWIFDNHWCYYLFCKKDIVIYQ